MQNPLISVIIPNYNHAKYLDERISSVLNQTYKNFEVIILDDCSPDNGESKSVIENYRGNIHVKHIVYNETNSGSTFVQWRKGFELAEGDIVWIAESDDYCSNTFLEELSVCWIKYPNCTVVQCLSKYVWEDGEPLDPKRVYDGRIVYEDGQNAIKKHMICSNFYIPNASAVTFKREVALEISDDYMDYKASGDRLFWIHMLEHGNLCTVNKPLSCFRQHRNKVSSMKELDGTQCVENYRINQYLNEKGYIKGIYRLLEYSYYWNYIKYHDFQDEDVRVRLKRLWFPKWWQCELTKKISSLFVVFAGVEKF